MIDGTLNSLEATQKRIDRLEQCVFALARGILSHEYSKDLNRFGVEECLKVLVNEGNIDKALGELV